MLGFAPTARRMTPSSTSAVFALTARAWPLRVYAVESAAREVWAASDGEVWGWGGELIEEEEDEPEPEDEVVGGAGEEVPEVVGDGFFGEGEAGDE